MLDIDSAELESGPLLTGHPGARYVANQQTTSTTTTFLSLITGNVDYTRQARHTPTSTCQCDVCARTWMRMTAAPVSDFSPTGMIHVCDQRYLALTAQSISMIVRECSPIKLKFNLFHNSRPC